MGTWAGKQQGNRREGTLHKVAFSSGNWCFLPPDLLKISENTFQNRHPGDKKGGKTFCFSPQVLRSKRPLDELHCIARMRNCDCQAGFPRCTTWWLPRERQAVAQVVQVQDSTTESVKACTDLSPRSGGEGCAVADPTCPTWVVLVAEHLLYSWHCSKLSAKVLSH